MENDTTGLSVESSFDSIGDPLGTSDLKVEGAIVPASSFPIPSSFILVACMPLPLNPRLLSCNVLGIRIAAAD